MDEKEMKQYCVAVNVRVWAEDAEHAMESVVGDMNYLCGLDTPIAGFDVLFADEQKIVYEDEADGRGRDGTPRG